MNYKITRILEYNNPEFNYIKLAEELAELSEVVLKMYVKNLENRPPMSKLIEEMGDVLLRMRILAIQEKINVAVNERVEQKANKLMEYIEQGKYKGGV